MSNNKTPANTDAAELVDDELPRAVQNGMSQEEYDTWMFLNGKRALNEPYTYAIKQSDLTRFVHQQQQKAVRETLERLLNSRQVIPRHSGTDSFYPSNYIEVVQVENIKQELNRLDNQQSDREDGNE